MFLKRYEERIGNVPLNRLNFEERLIYVIGPFHIFMEHVCGFIGVFPLSSGVFLYSFLLCFST